MAVIEGNGGERVSYTTKELLERIDSKIDQLSSKLDLKADLTDVKDLLRRVEELEKSDRSTSAVSEFKRFAYGWIPLVINVGLVAYALITHK